MGLIRDLNELLMSESIMYPGCDSAFALSAQPTTFGPVGAGLEEERLGCNEYPAWRDYAAATSGPHR